MMRAVIIAVLSFAGIIAGDVLFRTSLLRQIRPVILSPSDQAVIDPPVHLVWDGPRQMRVLLSIAGEAERDLGVHESPFDIPSDRFPRDGGYSIEVRSLSFRGWIRAARWFQVHAAPEHEQEPGHKTRAWEAKDLLRALEAARTARDKAFGRTKFLSEENAALRDESERLAKQLEALYKSQDDETERTAELEKRLAQLTEENRALTDENAAIRQRLSTVVPCTVWGYFSFPQPQMIPFTRRALNVSDGRGQVFRTQPECEIIRRADPTAASICFCVGNSWGG
jgi:regulator of replication initiation timing